MYRLCCVLVLLISIKAASQSPFIFNRLSLSDGLATNKVNCIWQDSVGYMWIGTENGLQRFDGRRFVRFGSYNSKYSLPPSGIDQILGGKKNNLWIRSGNEIGQFNTITFHYTRIPYEEGTRFPLNPEIKLFTDSKHNIFVRIRDNPLMFFNPQKGEFTAKDLPIQFPNSWRNNIHCLFEDMQRNQYWMCSDQGIACFDATNNHLFHAQNNPENLEIFDRKDLKYVFDIHRDKNEGLWFIYWNFTPDSEGSIVNYFNINTEETVADTINLNKTGTVIEYLNWFYETRQGQVWTGGVNTLFYADGDKLMPVSNLSYKPEFYGIDSRSVNQMLEDKESNLWFCTDNGLFVISNDQYSVYNYTFDQDYANDVQITDIIETSGNEFWVSTWGNGILFYDRDFNHQEIDAPTNKGIRPLKMVFSIYQHSKTGRIWAGCRYGYVMVLDPETKEVLHTLQPPVFENLNVNEGSTIFQITEASNGDLLFATHGGKLVKWQWGTPLTNHNFLSIQNYHTSLRCVFINDKREIWIGTESQGIYVLDSAGTQELANYNLAIQNSTATTDNKVFDIVQYNDSIYFAGTAFLNVINTASGSIKQYTIKDGLPGLNIRQLVIDHNGTLWFSCNNGLGSYNIERGLFATYNDKNGIIYADRKATAKNYTKDGKIWFGVENALYNFVPEKLSKKSTPQKVTITDLKVINSYIPLDSLLASQKIKLKPNQNSMTFYFSTLSFLMQDKLVYYYKLSTVDKDWKRVEGEPLANYTTLKPGSYKFEVKCVNMQGEESSEITHLEFRIQPHFYQSGWFLIMLALLLSGLMFSYYRLRLNKLLAVEKLRVKVARDLHDDVGSTLSTINILSSMAKTKLLTDPVQTSDYLSKITDNSQQMMEAMDDIVWSIKPDNDNMQKILARMREYASSILEPKNIGIQFNVALEVNNIKLPMEARRDLFLLYKEAVNNSAKYSKGTQVHLEFTYHNHLLRMQISDNGIGFNLKNADTGNGLGNMQKRAELLHGKFSIQSSPEKGTSIVVTLPVHV